MKLKKVNEKAKAIFTTASGFALLYAAHKWDNAFVLLNGILFGGTFLVVGFSNLYYSFIAEDQADEAIGAGIFLKKNPKLDVLNHTSSRLLAGLTIAIGLVVSAFTIPGSKAAPPTIVDNRIIEFPIIDEVPASVQKKKLPPPPLVEDKPPTIEQISIVEDFAELPEESEQVFEMPEIPDGLDEFGLNFDIVDEGDLMDEFEKNFELEEEVETEHPIFIRVEEMPRFGSGEKDLLDYLYKRLRFTPIALENDIEGYVVLQFVVEKDGSISNINIARDPGGGLGNQVVKIVENMPHWSPGKQRDKPVRVKFTLPVNFRLN